MSTATKSPRPKMTAEQATHFDRMSIASYAQVAEQLTCGCEPYEDVFTFNRWKAQGMHVRKGEKAIRFPSWIRTEGKTDDDGNEQPGRLIARMMPVFCRCQVEAND